jgi:hypothetical protein
MMPFTRSSFFRRTLTGSLVLGAAWWFHAHWIAPLQRHEVQARKGLAETRQRIEDARSELQVIRELGLRAARASASLTTLQGESLAEPAVVWLPMRLNHCLGGLGIEKVAIRLNAAVSEPGLAGYKRTYWNLNLPLQDGMRSMSGVLLAVAELEQRKSFVKVLDFDFRSDAAEPHGPVGVCNVEVLVRE